MISTASYLEAIHLGRRRAGDKQWLLDDVSLAVQPGDRLVVEGPSGAGKTLLLRAIAIVDPLDFGEVRWLGRVIVRNEVPKFRRQVVYLHQRAALLGRTVAESLEMPFSLAGHRRQAMDREQIVAWLEELGRTPAFLEQLVRDLSGGEIQITAMLRAMQLHPSILLLDEPTAAMDAKTSLAAEELLVHWASEQPDRRALVWVSHDADQSRRVATRTVHIRAGRVVRA